jgi:hypothetical protein
MRKRVSVSRCDGKPLTAPVSGLGRPIKMRHFASIDKAETFIRQVAGLERPAIRQMSISSTPPATSGREVGIQGQHGLRASYASQ